MIEIGISDHKKLLLEYNRIFETVRFRSMVDGIRYFLPFQFAVAREPVQALLGNR